MTKEFLQGNVAVAKSALQSGLGFFSFYPITPSSECGEYLAKVMDPRKFVNAYSEVEVFNMLYGASAAGARVMTSTSGCGLSLGREALSYAVGAELPMVIYDVVRFGPGLGGITPSNQDVSICFGVGHGLSKVPVLAPKTVQELADFTMHAFDIADLLRTPVVVLADAILGQMYEQAEIHKSDVFIPPKDWKVGNGNHRVITSRKITSYKMEDDEQAAHISKLLEKEKRMYEVCKGVMGETAKVKKSPNGIYITATGTTARALEEVSSELGIGYIIPSLLSPNIFQDVENINKPIDKLIVVEVGGNQLMDLMVYSGFRRENITSMIFPNFIPDKDDIINKMNEMEVEYYFAQDVMRCHSCRLELIDYSRRMQTA